MSSNKINILYSGKVNWTKITASYWVDDVQSLSKNLANGFIAIWLVNKVAIGEVKSGTISLPKELEWENPNYIIRVRLFNENEEWHIWKQGNAFKCRHRNDNSENGNVENIFTDNELILWGTQTKPYKNGFLESFEKRETSVIFPESIGRMHQNEKNKRLMLHTRNYIEYNELGQAGYVDSRFVDINFKEF